MMKTIQLFLLSLLVCGSVSAQTFQMHYGGLHDEAVYGMNGCADGGFVLTGSSKTMTNGAEDVLLLRTDAIGQLQWAKAWGGAQTENGYYAVELADHGFAVCGETFSTGQNGDAFFLRTDSVGNLTWFKTYGAAGYDIAYSFAPTSDGGFILAGLTEGTPAFNYDAFLIRTNANGDTLWTKTYGGPSIDHAVSVMQTSDGGFLFSGKCMSFGAGISDVWLMKTDANGTVQWSTVSGGAGWDEGMNALETSSGYVVCGGTNSSGAGDYDFLLMRFDFNGNRTFSRTYGGNHVEASYAVRQTSDGGFAFAGYTETYGPGHAQRLIGNNPPEVLGTDSANMMLIRVDANGDTLWTQAYGGFSKEECFGLVVLSNGFAVAGYTGSFGDSLEAILVRTDIDGHSGCNDRRAHPQLGTPNFSDVHPTFLIGAGFTVAQQNYSVSPGTINQVTLCASPLDVPETVQENISCYPVPASNELHITSSQEQLVSVELYDLSGRLLNAAEVNAYTTSIDVSALRAGMYVLRVQLRDGSCTIRKIEVR